VIPHLDKKSFWNNYTETWLKRFPLTPMQLDRYAILKNFCNNGKSTLDVACGSLEPLIICNHSNSVAVDLSFYALKTLKKEGFKGECICASSTNLPFKNLFFDVAICSELIEHLTIQEIQKTIKELQRSARKIMLTTPHHYMKAKILDPTHKHFFTEQQLKEVINFKSEICSSRKPYDNLNFYLPIHSPRFSNKKLGKTIYKLLDKAFCFPLFQKLLFQVSKGAFLIARIYLCDFA